MGSEATPAPSTDFIQQLIGNGNVSGSGIGVGPGPIQASPVSVGDLLYREQLLAKLQAQAAALTSYINSDTAKSNAALQAQTQTHLANLNAQINQLQGEIQLINNQTTNATQLQINQNKTNYDYAALNQAARQFAQQFGLSNQQLAFDQNLQGANFAEGNQQNLFNQNLARSNFAENNQVNLFNQEFQGHQSLVQQGQFNANYGLNRDQFNNTQALNSQEFNNSFGLQQDQFAFQKQQAARQLASNPFDSVNYMMYLSGMAASPIGTQPGYSGLNDQFNRYGNVGVAPLTNQAPDVLRPPDPTLPDLKGNVVVPDATLPNLMSSVGVPQPTIQAAGSVNNAANNAAQNMAIGGPMANMTFQQPGNLGTVTTGTPNTQITPAQAPGQPGGLDWNSILQMIGAITGTNGTQKGPPPDTGVATPPGQPSSPKGPPPDNPTADPASVGTAAPNGANWLQQYLAQQAQRTAPTHEGNPADIMSGATNMPNFGALGPIMHAILAMGAQSMLQSMGVYPNTGAMLNNTPGTKVNQGSR